MNRNVQVLEEVYQNAEMAVESLSSVLPKISSPLMKNDVNSQMIQFSSFAQNAERLLRSFGYSAKEKSAVSRFPAKVGIAVNSFVDSSSSHFAEMIIKGYNVGIVSLSKTLNENKDMVTQEAALLAQQLLDFEENSIEKLKSYL